MKRVRSILKSGHWMLDTRCWFSYKHHTSSIRHLVSSIVLWLLMMFISNFSYAQDIYIHSNAEGTSVGESLTVDVMARNVADLSAFEFCISFDKGILEAVGVVRGSLWDNPSYLWNTGEIDNTSGVISFTSGAAYSGSNPSRVSVDANGGVLASITFGAISAGISPVNLTDVLMYDVNGRSISINVVNGDVSVNALPSASNLSITPSSPLTTDDLTGSYTYSDADNDPEGNTEVRWYRDGILQTAYNNTLTVPSSATSKGEQWNFTVRPSDGMSFGKLQTSGSVTIGNTVPTASNLGITPVSPKIGDDLVGSYDYIDADGDPESGSEIRWYKNDILQTAYNDLLIVPSSAVSDGDKWHFTARPCDGTDYGTLQASPIVTVQNSSPTAEAGGPYSGEEGSPVTFDGSGSSHPDGAMVSYQWDFGDGTSGAEGVTASHVYADNGTYTVTLTVTDSDGDTDTDTATVTIENVAPSEVDVGLDQTVNEGDTVSFSGSFSDPGSGDTHTIEWDFGDGSGKISGTLTPTHTYADDGTYTVTLTVTDDDGGVGTDVSLVTVNNIAPNAEAGGPYSGVAGELITFTGSGTDPGADTLTYSWDFGDGSPAETGQIVSHIYSASGTYTATLTVTDDDGGEHTDAAEVTINPAAAPTVYVSVDMSLKTFKRYWQATATVTVRDKDAYGSPIGRAKVYGHWDGAYSGSVSGETRKNGNVSFNTGWIQTPGTVTFTVDKVVKGEQECIPSGVISCSISKSPGAEEEFVLAQNYPNPSNPGTWIPFAIAKDCQVTIKIYNVTGKLVRTLDLGYLDAGVYTDKGKSAYWDGRDENGERVSSAVYFYVMEAGEYRASRKMLIAK